MTMLAERQISRQKHRLVSIRWSDSRFNAPTAKHLDVLIAILLYSLLYFVSFGRSLKAGRYLDEWELFGKLHFLPHSFLDYFVAMQNHWCFVIRPGSSFLFSSEYFFFGDNPFGYHACNAVFEIASVVFLYLAMRTLSGNKLFSLVTGILFLLYSNHITSHYHIGCSVHNFALSLFNLSLWLFFLNCKREDFKLRLASYSAFCMSIVSYEFCMPLVALHAAGGVYLLRERGSSLKESFKRILSWMIPFALMLISFAMFRTKILHLFGYGSVYRMSFSFDHLIKVYTEGFKVSLLLPIFEYCCEAAKDFFSKGIAVSGIMSLVAAVAGVVSSIVIFKDTAEVPSASKANGEVSKLLFLCGFGFIAFVLGYSTFAIAPDYVPAITTMTNRINTPATPGAAIVLAALLCLLVHFVRNKFAKKVLASGMMGLIVAVLLPCNWELEKPWLISNEVQKRIISILKEHESEFPSNSSIILANTPRWVMWASLFDSSWDFQSAVRVVLNRQDIKGGVVSERMHVTPHVVRDVSRGYLCGEYEFESMYMLFPATGKVVRVRTASNFIDTVERDGMSFGLDRNMPKTWRQQLKGNN